MKSAGMLLGALIVGCVPLALMEFRPQIVAWLQSLPRERKELSKPVVQKEVAANPRGEVQPRDRVEARPATSSRIVEPAAATHTPPIPKILGIYRRRFAEAKYAVPPATNLSQVWLLAEFSGLARVDDRIRVLAGDDLLTDVPARPNQQHQQWIKLELSRLFDDGDYELTAVVRRVMGTPRGEAVRKLPTIIDSAVSNSWLIEIDRYGPRPTKWRITNSDGQPVLQMDFAKRDLDPKSVRPASFVVERVTNSGAVTIPNAIRISRLSAAEGRITARLTELPRGEYRIRLASGDGAISDKAGNLLGTTPDQINARSYQRSFHIAGGPSSDNARFDLPEFVSPPKIDQSPLSARAGTQVVSATVELFWHRDANSLLKTLRADALLDQSNARTTENLSAEWVDKQLGELKERRERLSRELRHLAADAADVHVKLKAAGRSPSKPLAVLAQRHRSLQKQLRNVSARERELLRQRKRLQLRIAEAVHPSQMQRTSAAKLRSPDLIKQVAVRVVGESKLHLRGPRSGVNRLRVMIRQLDTPAGNVRFDLHRFVLAGRDETDLAAVSSSVEDQVALARFRTRESLRLLNRAVRETVAGLENCNWRSAFFGRAFSARLALVPGGETLLQQQSISGRNPHESLVWFSLAAPPIQVVIFGRFQELLKANLGKAERSFWKLRGKPGSFEGLDAKSIAFAALRAHFGLGKNEHIWNDGSRLTPIQWRFLLAARAAAQHRAAESDFRERLADRSVLFRKQIAAGNRQQLLTRYRRELAKLELELISEEQKTRAAWKTARASIERILKLLNAATNRQTTLSGRAVADFLNRSSADRATLEALERLVQRPNLTPVESATDAGRIATSVRKSLGLIETGTLRQAFSLRGRRFTLVLAIHKKKPLWDRMRVEGIEAHFAPANFAATMDDLGKQLHQLAVIVRLEAPNDDGLKKSAAAAKELVSHLKNGSPRVFSSATTLAAGLPKITQHVVERTSTIRKHLARLDTVATSNSTSGWQQRARDLRNLLTELERIFVFATPDKSISAALSAAEALHQRHRRIDYLKLATARAGEPVKQFEALDEMFQQQMESLLAAKTKWSKSLQTFDAAVAQAHKALQDDLDRQFMVALFAGTRASAEKKGIRLGPRERFSLRAMDRGSASVKPKAFTGGKLGRAETAMLVRPELIANTSTARIRLHYQEEMPMWLCGADGRRAAREIRDEMQLSSFEVRLAGRFALQCDGDCGRLTAPKKHWLHRWKSKNPRHLPAQQFVIARAIVLPSGASFFEPAEVCEPACRIEAPLIESPHPATVPEIFSPPPAPPVVEPTSTPPRLLVPQNLIRPAS